MTIILGINMLYINFCIFKEIPMALNWKPRSPNIEVCESTINRTLEIAETLNLPFLALHHQPLSSLPTSCEASPGHFLITIMQKETCPNRDLVCDVIGLYMTVTLGRIINL